MKKEQQRDDFKQSESTVKTEQNSKRTKEL